MTHLRYNIGTMIKRTLKKIGKAILILFLLLLIIPYFIPTDFKKEVPLKPYENSVFFMTDSGLRLHTQVYPAVGEEKGKILLIHGLMASTFSYRHNSQALSEQGYTVIAVDLPGFGYSDKPSDLQYTQTNFAKFMWEMLEDYDAKYESTTSWHLVGHSMGATTTLAMALQNKTRIIDITMIDGAVTQGSNSNAWLMGTPIGAWLKVGLRYFLLNEATFKNLLTDVYQGPVPQEAIDGYLAPVTTKGTINGLLQFVKSAKNTQISEVKDLGLKINLIWGGNDTWVPISAMDEIESTVSINKTYVFPSAGHTPHETEADFNSVLLGMIE
jgi:2-hydroxy-6-oxonona-2,4-dienedioate hydrolase